jgi:hypothetical protein
MMITILAWDVFGIFIQINNFYQNYRRCLLFNFLMYNYSCSIFYGFLCDVSTLVTLRSQSFYYPTMIL